MTEDPSFFWKQALRSGLIAGGVAILVSLVGLVEAFGDTDIITGLVSLGELILLAPVFLFAYMFVRGASGISRGALAGMSALLGFVAGLLLTLLVILGSTTNMREMFVNASPALFDILTRGVPFPLGALMPPIQCIVAAWISLGIILTPERYRKSITQGILWVIVLGTLRDQILLITVLQVEPFYTILRSFVFAQSGLSLIGATIVFALSAGLTLYLDNRQKVTPVMRTPQRQKTTRIILFMGLGVLIALLPHILGLFYSEILDTTGLFIMMGLGLNIVVGFAGLLDLGYVAFYAIGAYTMGVLTSTGLGLYDLTFWQALPFALLAAWLAGILLGLPVLRMRGDYLAIVTLGFGEIVRLLALSDWLRGTLGGTQGIQRIAQPQIGPLRFDSIQSLYYLIVIGIIIVAFVAWRLKDSRLGRSWMAIREDEDVAQAMGINLVITKLMAFSTGALFAGLAGALGAAKLTSVYPHSMTFLVSINVLVLIIIGGMGSIPGVFVGALVLVGLPGILTEFEEYRLWFYGLALVFMMLQRPEGLWPEARRKLELHEAEEEELVPIEEMSPAASFSELPGDMR
jgi:branched-chain amino acid transport system permease protein